MSRSGRQHLIYSIYSMTTLLDHKKTLAYLAYLGFPGESTTAALKVTQPRKSDRRKGKSSRNVFLCYVCGAAGSGKTSLLRLFAGKPYRDVYVPTTKPISVVNSVEIDGIEKYLVVRPLERRRVLFLSLRSERSSDADVAFVLCFAITDARVWIQLRSRNAAELETHRRGRCYCIHLRLERYKLVLVHQ